MASKYNGLCTYVRETAQARGAIVIVFSGNLGHGFAAQMPSPDETIIVKTLREVADMIERGTA